VSASQCFKECIVSILKDPVDQEGTTQCHIPVNYTNVKTSKLTNCNTLKDFFYFINMVDKQNHRKSLCTLCYFSLCNSTVPNTIIYTVLS